MGVFQRSTGINHELYELAAREDLNTRDNENLVYNSDSNVW